MSRLDPSPTIFWLRSSKPLSPMGDRTLVVGLKLTPECRESLTWLVAKLAQPGDHVIAVHVTPSTTRIALCDDQELDPATKQDLDNTFHGVLGLYQSLCNLKQIKLDIKVVVWDNVKEALLETTKMEDADRLILGTSKYLPTGFSTSLAKFYLKRLPSSCSVTVVDRGEVIFEKEGLLNISDRSKISSCTQTCAPGVLHRGMRKLIRCKKQVSDVKSAARNSSMSSNRSFVSEANSFGSDKSSPDSPVSVLQSNPEPEKSHSSSVKKSHGLSDNPSFTGAEEHGWPLRVISIDKITASSRSLARNMSVVNWVMKLPDRSPIVAGHSSGRTSASSASELLGEETQKSTDDRHADGQDAFEACMGDVTEMQKRHADSEDISEACKGEATDNGGGLCALTLSEKLQLLCSRDMGRFTLDELGIATKNFSEENLIGRGGCSMVYRGVLSSGLVVAIKCLNEVTPNTEQELLTEVEMLATLRHRNVVSLLGYCVSGQSRMLVYNIAKNGNLEQRLHGGTDIPVLDWPARQRIAFGASEALEYLHSGCPKPVVHRDVKSSNILLSSNYEPQVSDFGLAEWAPTSSPYITCTDVVGTFGYLAPEYFMFGRVNEKTDVYSFGVVLLELITGKHAIDVSKPKGQENLVFWGRPLVEAGQVEQLVDPRLDGRYDKSEMKQMMLAAALCLRQSPQLRPTMKEISELLRGEKMSMISWASQQLRLSKPLDDEYFKSELYVTSSSVPDISLTTVVDNEQA